MRLVPGIRAHGGVSLVDRIAGRVLHAAHEAPAAPHDKSPIPFLRQQQFEADVAANHAFHFDISRTIRIFLLVRSDGGDRFEDDFRQAQLAEVVKGESIECRVSGGRGRVGRLGEGESGTAQENECEEEAALTYIFFHVCRQQELHCSGVFAKMLI